MVPLLVGRPCYYVGSVDVMRQLSGQEGKIQLVKPLELTTANGEMWKKDRRIVGPAFNARKYLLREFHPPTVRRLDLILSYSLVAAPHSLGEQIIRKLLRWKTLSIASKTLIPRFILPGWAYYLPIKSVIHLMGELVLRRRQDLSLDEDTDKNSDVFSQLVDASDGSSKYTLEVEEVLSIDIETSASVLVTTIVCLALNQDEQAKAFDEIQRVVPSDRDPSRAALISIHIPRIGRREKSGPYLGLYARSTASYSDVMENVTVQVAHPAEGCPRRAIREADWRITDHNPNYFPEPDKYIPSRWYGRPEQDNPEFDFGPRACIGRKFAQIESTLFLCLLREWKLDIVLKDGETEVEYGERVLGNASLVGSAFGLGPVPIRLLRRR
ncbi:cytochrome P450 [Mycena latifolia]|nr:cytochrome P450 [Mycena latifolia]